MSLLRAPIASLAGLALQSSVRIGGRVLASDAGGSLVRDDSGHVQVRGGPSLGPGSLVVLEGRWDGTALVDARPVEAHLPSRSPFDGGSDFQRWSAHGGRLQRNLGLRSRVMRAIRDYFDSAGFLEVETPLLVPSPGLDPHLDAMEVVQRGEPRFLITSPEYQMKRLLVGGCERIYQLCKCFRHDEAGARHEPEFTMLEWYRAFAGVSEVMADTEQLVAHVATTLHGRPVLEAKGREIDVTPPWPRLTVRDAFRRFADVDMDAVLPDEEHFFRVLVEQIEPALERQGALFLCEYPASMASLARTKPEDPSVAERVEAYVAGIELCNGFGELTCATEQRARLERDQATRSAAGQPVYPIDERFLRALEEGMPPSGGNALGVDRLVMLAVGAGHIEDVLATPSRWV